MHICMHTYTMHKCTCINICVHMHTGTHMSAYTHVHMCVRICTCTHVHVWLHMHSVCVHKRVCACTHATTCVYMHRHTVLCTVHMHVYTHTCTHTQAIYSLPLPAWGCSLGFPSTILLCSVSTRAPRRLVMVSAVWHLANLAFKDKWSLLLSLEPKLWPQGRSLGLGQPTGDTVCAPVCSSSLLGHTLPQAF